MKVRTLKYIIKEGISNTYKNKLMSLASVSIVVACLIVFGISLLLSINLNYNASIWKQQPEIKVFCRDDLDDTQVGRVEEAIKQNIEIKSYTMVTRKQAFEKLKERLGENADVLEGYDEDFLPVSFNITLNNLENSAKVVEELKNVSGVDKVYYSKEINDFISKLTNWINIVCAVLVILLLVFAVSIIVNTIRLTVFARRREINIMKCIGATDWFIRWPFIVEGVVIGLGGAIIAFILTRISYIALERRFNSELSTFGFNLFKIVSANEVQDLIMGLYTMIGIIVGALGSVISIRKHLKV